MKLNENSIEQSFIDQLVDQHGYEYFHGTDIAPYSNNPQREGFESDRVIDQSELLAGESRK